jgi:hypothetical protein
MAEAGHQDRARGIGVDCEADVIKVSWVLPEYENDFTLGASAQRSLEMTDRFPPALRKCVHEFGSQIVQVLIQNGVTKPNNIRDIVHACWKGAREANQRSIVANGASAVVNELDWLLEQNGSRLTAATLLRVLKSNGMVIVPFEPSDLMITASMTTVSGHDLTVSKYTKHKMRLKRGIEAVARKLWPQVFDDVANRR